ncbi:MAG: VCBS repeat-containing protein, partial [Thermoanaerobaculia bacterium]|nr:VCBS repeat-containing protein [Thermoanaerobaculia bacterium]
MRATARSLSLVATVTATAGTIHGQPFFEEVTAAVGIEFVHRHFATGRKYMPENMGAGVAILDVDGDGRLDIYLVQGTGSLPGADPDPTATNRLYRQTETGVFEDVTAAAGAGDPGYGMGVAFGDVDGDGDLDLFVSNYGPDAFYRNRGDGSFEEATAEAGLGDPDWAASTGFFDADGDGDLDLWVTRYLDWSPAGNKFCGNAQANLRSYCHPDVYDGARDLLYRNDGAGAFTEIGRAAGLADSRNDKGLGVTFADLDGDGHMDVYVANDSTRNYLYLGDGTGRFREEGLLAGVGLNARGDREASMGVEVGDLNADGRPDLFVTHLDEETNTYYASSGPGLWLDRTAAAGLAEPSRPWVGFGTVVADFDLDGDEDLFVANGHIIDNIDRFDAARRHRQPAQLFLGDGTGTFTVAAGALGLDRDLVGRGAAGGDLDG